MYLGGFSVIVCNLFLWVSARCDTSADLIRYVFELQIFWEILSSHLSKFVTLSIL